MHRVLGKYEKGVENIKKKLFLKSWEFHVSILFPGYLVWPVGSLFNFGIFSFSNWIWY